jgi:glycosyltransferase involved in cell wall biosynthesis
MQHDMQSTNLNKSEFSSVSVVIPALNEADSILELFQRLEKIAEENQYEMQIILVDDGSDDNTATAVANFVPAYISSVLYIQFSTNLGKSAALTEGAKNATGDIIVTMDADLQDLPEEIPNLIAKINDGYDVVSGWKIKRNDPLFGKKIPSLFFNWLVRKILRTTLRDINCGLKAYRREVWKNIRIYGELHRFIPALAANQGYKIAEIEVKHSPRLHGVSKYGMSRFVKGILDLLTVYFLNTYQQRPLHFFGLLGGVLLFAGTMGGIYLTVLWFLGYPIGTRPLLLLSVLLIIVGVQIILFGLFSQLQIELFYRTNHEKPNVTIKEFTRTE